MDHRITGVSRRRMLYAAGVGVALTAFAQPTRAVPVTRAVTAGPGESGVRADLAEQALLARHVRPLWGLPGMQLGWLSWPPTLSERFFGEWHYWWQAHLLDCAIDAAHRARTPERVDRVAAIARGIRTRNATGWTNNYYDDMAWLALALERAQRQLGIPYGGPLADLKQALLDGWNPEVGALPWRNDDNYYNTPSNGPAGIALARLGEVSRARELADFLYRRLYDPASGLIMDGVHEPEGRIDRSYITYCQGVAIGLATELAVRTGDPVHRERARALVEAVAAGLTVDGVIVSAKGHDAGLFMGILTRYLAQTALVLDDPLAASLVHSSARAAWSHRAEVDGLPLFGADWHRPATVSEAFPQAMDSSIRLSGSQARYMSVQLSAWMLLEADHLLITAGR